MLVAFSVALGWIYFSVPDTRQQMETLRKQTAPWFKLGWIRLDEGEIRATLAGAKVDSWHTLVVRTALDRWRLRTVAKEPFDNLMSDYARGWWSCPPAASWVSLFEENDRAWRESRREAQRSGVLDQAAQKISAKPDGADTLLISMPPCATSDLGSLAVFHFSSQRNDIPGDAAPNVLWQTSAAHGFSALRRRLAMVKLDETTSGSQTVKFELEVDLSQEPAWLAPNSSVGSFMITSPNAHKWTLQGMGFGDHPQLRP